MHPNPAFRSQGDLLARVGAIGFAHVLVAGPEPGIVHAPVSVHDDDLRFHVARANRLTKRLNEATVFISVTGAEGYISPNWYLAPGDQVPTWNYEAIEIEGRAALLDDAGLIAQLDALAAAHEPRVNPAAPWTRDKMDPLVFGRMLRGIVGFAVAISAIRATVKHSQNKSPGDQTAVTAGLRAAGNDALAQAMTATFAGRPA